MGQTGSEPADFIGAVVSMSVVLPPNFVDDAPAGLGLLDTESCWVYVKIGRAHV